MDFGVGSVDTPDFKYPWPDDDRIVPVGWLTDSEDFDRGKVGFDFVVALFKLLRNPWQPAVAMGFHSCPFCKFSGGPRTFGMKETNDSVLLGRDNVYVPSEGRILVAPSLVIHYVDSHQYRPPDEFQSAVLNCPEMRSMEYLKRFERMLRQASSGAPMQPDAAEPRVLRTEGPALNPFGAGVSSDNAAGTVAPQSHEIYRIRKPRGAKRRCRGLAIRIA